METAENTTSTLVVEPRTLPKAESFNGNQFTFVEKGIHPDWVEQMLGPFEANEKKTFVEFEGPLNWANLMAAVGAFKSTSDARRNGWNRVVEPGLSTESFKKGKKVVWVLTKMAGVNDSEISKNE